MNKLTKRNISFKRKDSFNKKLAIQIGLSIMLVFTVIITKQVNTDLSNEVIDVTSKTVNESTEPSKIKNSFSNIIAKIENFSLFSSKDKNDFASPVNGLITQSYGLNTTDEATYYNHGITILSNTQTVLSISPGIVTAVGNNEKLNNYIVVEGDGKKIIYGKLSEYFVSEGEKISKEDIIASLDENEKTLHLEIWQGSESINPTNLFEIKK